MATSASKVYAKLLPIRDDYVKRGQECAELTIPSSFLGDREERAGQEYSRGEQPDPHQSVGARGVRNLASKMMLTLLPSNSPFFNLVSDEELLDLLEEQMGISRGEVEIQLQKKARTIHQAMLKSNLRTESPEIFMSLLVDGSPLIYVTPEMQIQVFRLDQFVIERDPSGKLLQIVIKEAFDINSLDDSIRAMVDSSESKDKKKKEVLVYTHIKLVKGQYTRHQEVSEKIIPESETTYPKGVLPWIVPRAVKTSGEHYPRSYVEEYLGDLRSFEALSESLNDMAAASSRVLFLVSPSAVTDIDDLNGAPNGSFIPGRLEDISPLLAQLSGDFSVAFQQAQSIEQRLAQAFLLLSSLQRNAERVTAQEIRLMAEELDNALGGLFSIMSAEFQMPLVKAFIYRLTQSTDFVMPKEVEPNIVTGLDALGRGQDLSKLNSFMSQILEVSQAGIDVSMFVNAGELVKRMAAGNGIDPNGLIKTADELAAEKQQAQQEQMMQGPVADTMAKGMQAEMDPGKQAQLMKAQAETQGGT